MKERVEKPMLQWFRPKNKHVQYDMTGSELITVHKQKTLISKQYRTIRTNLEFTTINDGSGTIEQVG